MTAVVVPAGEKNKDLFAKAAQITAAQAVPSTSPAYNQAQQLAYQLQREHVLALLDRKAIAGGPAALLSAVAYKGTVPALAAITALQAQIATWTTTNPQLATSKGRDLEALQLQAITELLNGGNMAPSAVLAAFNFTGAN